MNDDDKTGVADFYHRPPGIGTVLCEAPVDHDPATPGPWANDGKVVRDLGGAVIATAGTEVDAEFIADARTGWMSDGRQIRDLERHLARAERQRDEAVAALREEHAQHAVTTARVETLLDTLHLDRTGLAAALDKVRSVAVGYAWAVSSRGPYAWDDAEYRREFGRMLATVTELTGDALKTSGETAHAECCGRGRWLDKLVKGTPKP